MVKLTQPIVFACAFFLFSCSFLKLDKESNCLNDKAGCFKSDTTRPTFVQTVLPAPGVVVSTLGEVQLLFSEELNNPQPSDFTYSEPGLTVQSVSKIDKFTYRLLNNRNPNQGGPLTLSFTGLKDYNGNQITNGTITYTINLNIPVTPSATHTGVSTGGYPTVTVSWHYSYTPVIAGDTVYHVRLTTGAEDCSAGSPITPVTATPLVNSVVQSYDETNGTTIAATTYTFSVNTAVITSLGAQKILICLNNINNNKFGTGVVNVVRDDSDPTLVISPPSGNYISAQTLTFTCSDNADKVIYNLASNVGLGVDPVAADVAEPTFNPATGEVTNGEVYSSSNKPETPYTSNTTRTIYKYRCIDKAGNIYPEHATPALVSGVYRINTTFPTVTYMSLTKTGATPAVDITAVGAGGYTSATLEWRTNQVGQDWEIRSGGSDCGAGGTVVASGSGVTATPSPPNTPIQTTILHTSPGIAVGLNSLRVCVTNGTDWGQTGLNLLRDDTAPTTLTVNVPPGDYGSTQNLVFTCTDYEDRITFTESFSVPTATPSDPGDPLFDADGRRTVGTLHTGPYAVTTDTTSLIGKKTRIKYRCIDKAGHVTAVNDITYTIDSLLPTVTVQNQTQTAVSTQPGAHNSAQFTWLADRQISGYDIRRGSTNCTDGTVLTVGSNLSSASVTAAGTQITSAITADNANFPATGSYTIHICTTNSIGAKGYTTRTLVYDNTAPTFAGLTSLSSSGGGNFTLNWSAATDGTGSGIAYYNIYRADNLGGPYVTAQQMAAHPATSINVTVPVATNTYYYVAGAVDNAGNETKVTVAELATKPTISVTMISELSNTNFTLSDGTVSAPLTATTATTTAAWSTTLSAGSTYNFSISNVPAGKVCSLRQRQFGTLSSNINITIDCIIGYMVGGRYQSVPAAPLNYMLYRGLSSTTYSGGTAINGMAMIGNMLFFVRRENATDSSIQKCNMTNCAGTLVTVVSTTAGLMRHLATDGANLYAANPNGSAATMRIQKYSALLTGQAAPQAEIDPGLSVGYHSGLALDANRNLLYVGVRGAAEIKRIHLDTGVVDTLSSIVSQHEGLALVGDDLYAATPDGGNCILRAVSAHTASALSLFAGSCGVTESYADGSLTEARFARAHGLVSDGTDLYVSEFAGNRIRRINLRKGIVSTIAGGGGSGTDGTGPIAGFASLFAMSTDGRRLLASEGGTARLRTVVDDGLVGYWPLNATTADYASAVTTNYALSATGGFTNPSGRYNETNGSYRFDGSNYLDAADQNQYDLSSEYTISVWINRNAAGVMRIVDKATANNCDGYNFDITSDNRLRLLYCIVNGVGQDVVSGTAVPVNQWVHVLGTFSGTRQQARLYINGHLDAEKSTGAGVSLTNALSVRLGMDHSGANGFSGAMADVRLYNRVLSEGEINELAQDALSTQVGASYNTGATGLLTHYDFNAQGATPSLTDRGPMGLNLTALNSPAAHSGKDGDTAGAFYLNSTNQYLTNSTTTGLPMSAHPRTLCGWIKPASYPAANTGHILVSYSGTTRSQLGLGNYSGSQGVDYHSNDNLVHIPYTVPLNTWSHLCAAYTGTQVSLYVNGSLLGTQAAVSNSAFGATGTFVGAQPNVAYLAHGGVDDVRIYNHTLSAAQIRQLATQVPAGLMARYDFNGDNVDSSGFANTMTATGSPVADNDRYLQTNSSYRFNGGKFGTATPIMTSLDNVSLSAWFKQTAMHSWLQYIVINGGGGDGYGIFLDGPAGNVVSAILGGVGYLRTTVAAPLHVWNHVALVRSAGTWSIYLNGASMPINAIMPATITSTPTLPSGGAYIGLDSGSGNYFEGAIDDARFYNRALSATEIRALAGYHPMQVSTWNATPGSSSMKLHYIPENVGALADGATITQWDDVSGHSMHLFQGTPGSRPQYAQSGINNRPAVNFNSNRIFTRPCNDTNLGGDNTTIIGAIRQTSNSGANKGLFEYGQKLIYLNGGGSQTFSYVRLGPDELKITSLPDFINLIAPNPNMIYSVSHSLAGGAIYKNGSNVTNGTPAASASQVCSTTGLYFGGRNGYDNFEGLFGDFLYFSTILSSADRRIAECYLSSKYSVPLDNSVTCD